MPAPVRCARTRTQGNEEIDTWPIAGPGAPTRQSRSSPDAGRPAGSSALASDSQSRPRTGAAPPLYRRTQPELGKRNPGRRLCIRRSHRSRRGRSRGTAGTGFPDRRGKTRTFGRQRKSRRRQRARLCENDERQRRARRRARRPGVRAPAGDARAASALRFRPVQCGTRSTLTP